jgi:hypothetical protein
MQRFSFAGKEAARNLLLKVRRALDNEDLDRAGGYVDRAVRLQFDEHEGAAPAALEVHMGLFCAVTDAAEQAAEDDERWLDGALHVLAHAEEPAACDLRDVLIAIDQDYTLSAHERRRIRSAIATVPDRAELRDLQLRPTVAQAAGMSRSALVRQAALFSASGTPFDLARVRRAMDEAERRLTSARQALG